MVANIKCNKCGKSYIYDDKSWSGRYYARCDLLGSSVDIGDIDDDVSDWDVDLGRSNPHCIHSEVQS